MESRRSLATLLILLQLYQGYMASVQVSPKYLVVNPGEEAIFSCKYNGDSTNNRLDTCIFKVGTGSYFLKPKKTLEKDGISFNGDDLSTGTCEMKIRRVEMSHNGNITCLVSPESDPSGQEGNMRLIVALEPQPPQMELSLGSEGPSTYREHEILNAICIVRDGRPAANISWYIGDEPITEGLKMPVETCTPQMKELCTLQQNLTRTLLASDDNKLLRCVATHHALKGETLAAEKLIYVNYPPKPTSRPFEIFGLIEGVTGNVPVVIEANPKPAITWTIGGEVIYENSNNGRYSVGPTQSKELGQYESVLVIDKLTHEDTIKEYRVTAHNKVGEAHYPVVLSTSPEPKVLEMDTGLIVLIVIAILLILLILAGVFFARAKGKCCFEAGDAEKRVASTNEGTENPAVIHHSSTEYISNSPELKKEKPKEDTPV